MVRAFRGAWIGLLLAVGCGPSQSEDFDQFCRVVNETNKENALNEEQKLEKITSRSEEYTKAEESKGADSAWKRIAAAPIDQKYALLESSAKAAGKGDWRCKGYEALLIKIIVQQT